MRYPTATSAILATLLMLPGCASSMKHRSPASDRNTERRVLQAVLENLKTYSNVQGRERLMDRRVLQWWEGDFDIRSEWMRFSGRHDAEMLERFRERGLIDGFASPKEREGFPPERWTLNRDEKTAAISLSSPRANETGGIEVLCWVETAFDFRFRGGRRLGFFALLLFSVERRGGKWEVIERKHIVIS